MKKYRSLTKKIANVLLLLPALLSFGCANLAETLFTEQKFVRIDEKVTENPIYIGRERFTRSRENLTRSRENLTRSRENLTRSRENLTGTGRLSTNATAYALPEKRPIRKIRILGEGTVTNLQIYVQQQASGFVGNWKIVKQIKGKVTFPIDISIVADTDTIAISKSTALLPTKKGRKLSGRIHTVEFYTVSSAN